ncbi:MAG TPA: FkbM family methyltransferase [Patescibacteria group bacterium]|nr:FkbM family methyltransferase [Patescibacteria group bacterium]
MRVSTIAREGLTFSYLNKEEFEFLYRDIFIQKVYEFPSLLSPPLIIDCGANIGLSVLYFRKRYPEAHIIAFEPNPKTYQILERNMKNNYVTNVSLVKAALAPKRGVLDFYVSRDATHPWSAADSAVKGKWYDSALCMKIQVPAVTLSSYITGRVDLLKMDIEGYEERVLREIEKKLDHVRAIVLEFHGNPANRYNNLKKILSILSRREFQYEIKEDGNIVTLPHDDSLYYRLYVYGVKTAQYRSQGKGDQAI